MVALPPRLSVRHRTRYLLAHDKVVLSRYPKAAARFRRTFGEITSGDFAYAVAATEAAMRNISESPIAYSREEMLCGLELLLGYAACMEPQSVAIMFLRVLIEDLKDLDDGVVGPLLRPALVRNRRRDGVVVREVKQAAAAVCEAMVKRGEHPRRAADKVARTVRECRVLPSQSVRGTTVLWWRRAWRGEVFHAWTAALQRNQGLELVALKSASRRWASRLVGLRRSD